MILQTLSYLFGSRYAHVIDLSPSQLKDSAQWAKLTRYINIKNKSTMEYFAVGFVKNMNLSKKEEEFAKSIDIERRLPVWKAISDLFLDIEVTSFHNVIAITLEKSGYDLETLEKIYYYEVAPVCYGNLLSVAGEWAGFSEEGLRQEIVRYMYRTKKYFLWRMGSVIFRRAYTFMTMDDWKKVSKIVREMRSG